MKNLLESLAILLVGLLAAAIVYWIVQYNMIADTVMVEEIDYEVVEKKKANATDYLDDLEGYEDVDVEVDATKETNTNTVVVKSELANDELDAAIEDKSKSSYTENLENYVEPEKEEGVKEVEEAKPASDTPSEAPAEEVSDEIGMAIDAALDDL